MVPKKDLDLLTWSRNFGARISVSPESFNLTEAQASEFEQKRLAYDAAYRAQYGALGSGTRSMSLTTGKYAAKAQLHGIARELYAIVRASRTVSSAEKIELGLHVRAAGPSAIPAPNEAPRVSVVSIDGRRVTVSIRQADSNQKGKPARVAGATLYSFIGEEPPADHRQWHSEGNVTRPRKMLTFADLTPGTKVWLTATWYSQRGKAGPGATPVFAHIGYGGAMPLSMQRAAA